MRKICENNGKSFKGVSKTKRKECMKRLSSITQFNIEFLLLFNSCRKVLEKMSAQKWIDVSQKCVDGINWFFVC